MPIHNPPLLHVVLHTGIVILIFSSNVAYTERRIVVFKNTIHQDEDTKENYLSMCSDGKL